MFETTSPCVPLSVDQDSTDAQRQTLDRFLRGVERRAYCMAQWTTRNRDDALELVQDAMLGFVRNYSTRPATEWPALFHSVLDSRLRDWQRRSRVRNRWMAWWPFGNGGDEAGPDPVEQIAGHQPEPWQALADDQTGEALAAALQTLPLRQRQTFLLRIWEGLDVADTALALGCGEGSVKTHLSRAMTRLRAQLEDHR
jgi:RNA polymerase sigma-70 factor (ECF subfamily)